METKSETITVKLVAYYYDLGVPEQRSEYREMCVSLSSSREKWEAMHQRTAEHRDFVARTNKTRNVMLETKYLFNNQWNSLCGLRLHDWHEFNVPNQDIKSGYYLDLPEKIYRLRSTRVQCGYCGHQDPKELVAGFCGECFGSEYLAINNLPLLRLHTVSDDSNRGKLSKAELDDLMPIYLEAQTKRLVIEDEKYMANAVITRVRKIKNANTEYDGFKWLADRKLNVSNCIYYSHTDSFAFGWKRPLDKEVKEELKTLLADFPSKWEFSKEK